jgi:hypothetical protein
MMATSMDRGLPFDGRSRHPAVCFGKLALRCYWEGPATPCEKYRHAGLSFYHLWLSACSTPPDNAYALGPNCRRPLYGLPLTRGFQHGRCELKAVAAVKWSGWDRIVAGSRVQRLRQTCHFCGGKLLTRAKHTCHARDPVERGLCGAVRKDSSSVESELGSIARSAIMTNSHRGRRARHQVAISPMTFASGGHGALESEGLTAFVQLTDKPPQSYRSGSES